MKKLLFSVALLAMPLSGCHLFTDPANIAGVTQEEANEVRVIKAALTVTGAYTVLGQQFDKGLVTASEAARVKASIDKANEAVKIAAAAVELEDLTVDAKLLALQNLLDALAREAILKGS